MQDNKENTIRLHPVGFVRNTALTGPYRQTDWRVRAGLMKERNKQISELVFAPELSELLDGIEGFSHIQVLYWAHRLPAEQKIVSRVHPMGNREFPPVGVFATGSPARPNPILLTVVRLMARNGNILRVNGLDALDGSPLLDIKPYNPDRRVLDEIRLPGWMQTINDEFAVY